MKRCVLLLMAIIWPSIHFASTPIVVTDIHTAATPSFTRITFTLTDKARGRVRSYTHPGRIEIEFANTYLRMPFPKKQFPHANIKQINQVWSQTNLKLVILIRDDIRWTTRYIPSRVPGSIRLQLDLSSNGVKKTVGPDLLKLFQQGVNETFHSLNAEIANRKSAMLAAKPIDFTTVTQKKIVTIVLDAGHGGKDPGALGNRGTKEKDVVLRIAKMLATEINKQPNRRAVLTRSGDYYMPLRQRLQLARRGKADLFIAIHADAHYNREAVGSSVYALSQHGASSEAARWLANRANYAELGSVSLNHLVDTDPILRSVMVDLAQTATIDASLRLGQRVLSELDDIAKLHHNEVERAPFVVLKSPDIPSILIETGFITNPTEERRLRNPEYQRQLVRAMRQGIEDYLKMEVGQNS